jgi:hypothetical protein
MVNAVLSKWNLTRRIEAFWWLLWPDLAGSLACNAECPSQNGHAPPVGDVRHGGRVSWCCKHLVFVDRWNSTFSISWSQDLLLAGMGIEEMDLLGSCVRDLLLPNLLEI